MLASIEASWSKLRKYFNKTDCATAYIATTVLNSTQNGRFLRIGIKRGSAKPKYFLKQF